LKLVSDWSNYDKKLWALSAYLLPGKSVYMYITANLDNFSCIIVLQSTAEYMHQTLGKMYWSGLWYWCNGDYTDVDTSRPKCHNSIIALSQTGITTTTTNHIMSARKKWHQTTKIFAEQHEWQSGNACWLHDPVVMLCWWQRCQCPSITMHHATQSTLLAATHIRTTAMIRRKYR